MYGPRTSDPTLRKKEQTKEFRWGEYHLVYSIYNIQSGLSNSYINKTTYYLVYFVQSTGLFLQYSIRA